MEFYEKVNLLKRVFSCSEEIVCIKHYALNRFKVECLRVLVFLHFAKSFDHLATESGVGSRKAFETL